MNESQVDEADHPVHLTVTKGALVFLQQPECTAAHRTSKRRVFVLVCGVQRFFVLYPLTIV